MPSVKEQIPTSLVQQIAALHKSAAILKTEIVLLKLNQKELPTVDINPDLKIDWDNIINSAD